jgi:hypothetical protein
MRIAGAGGKPRPVAALAQQQQPVVAQAVFLVGAGIALQKGLHFSASVASSNRARSSQ